MRVEALAEDQPLPGRHQRRARRRVGFQERQRLPRRRELGFESDAALPASYLVTRQTLVDGGLKPLDSILFVVASPGADLDAVTAGVNEITEVLPTVTTKDPQGYADEQKEQINLFLTLIYALLGLSVVIAVLGVITVRGMVDAGIASWEAERYRVRSE